MHHRRATLIAGFVLALAMPHAAAADCTTDTVLCLQAGRFLVEAEWKKSDGTSGVGHPVNLGADSGYFWFFDPENAEIVVKALDGCAVNGYGWFFAGGLTNLEVAITARDLATGETRTYTNPQAWAFLPIADTSAFGCPGGSPPSDRNPEEPRDDDAAMLSAPAVAVRPAGIVPGCEESESALCIDGRFRVEAWWQTASGRSGSARAVSMTSRSGYFWFFDPDNVELVVKVLDACEIGQGHWIFAAGLTTAGAQILVTDTFTSESRWYANPRGSSFRAVQDTWSFPSCMTATPTPPGPGEVAVNCFGEFQFHCFVGPSAIHVPVGASVHWTFRRCRHALASGLPEFPDGQWSSDGDDSGFTHTFTEAGTFPYYCTVHKGSGVVVVDP